MFHLYNCPITRLPRYLLGLLLAIIVTYSPPLIAQEGSMPVPTVVTTRAKLQDVSQNYQQVGRVEAIDKIDLRARVEGFLEQRPFREGGPVKKGDLLFVIEQASYKITVDQRKADVIGAEASLKNAKADLRRYKELRKKGASSQAQLDKAISGEATARAKYIQAEAALRKANLDLSYTEIKSPIDGKISRSKFSVGNLVSANDGPLATVTSIDPIYVTISISEKSFIEVRRGGINVENPPVAPILTLADGSLYDHIGEFNYIDNQVNQNTDTILVRAIFPNPDSLLVPGEFVHVEIKDKVPASAITVPQSTVQQDKNGYFLLVVNDQNKVEVRSIKVGDVYGNDWIVQDGLAVGERIILEGLQKVRPDQNVNVVEQ